MQGPFAVHSLFELCPACWLLPAFFQYEGDLTQGSYITTAYKNH